MGDVPYADVDEECQECGEAGAMCDRCGHTVCSSCLAVEEDCPICGDFCPECVMRLEEEREEEADLDAEPELDLEPELDAEPGEWP